MTDRVAGRHAATLRGAGFAALVYLASRAVVLMSMGVAGVVRGDWSMRRALTHWDGGWYLLIAESGYARGLPPEGSPATSNLAFFPLYPMLVRHVAGLTGLSPFRAGVALNLVFGVTAAILLWLLARDVGERTLADRAVALFSFFPATFVLSMTYSEPVMLALAIGCLLALVRHRWVLAGLLATLATASRPNAIALCVACAVGAALAIGRHRDWKSLAAPALSPLGLVAFFVFLRGHTGDAFIWSKAQQSGWGQGFDGGWNMIQAAGRQLADPGRDLNEVTAAVSLVFVVVAFVLLAWWKPPAVLSAYAAVVIGLGYLSPTLSSRPRFALTAVPLILAVAVASRRSFPIVLGASAVTLGAFTIISVSTLAITP